MSVNKNILIKVLAVLGINQSILIIILSQLIKKTINIDKIQ